MSSTSTAPRSTNKSTSRKIITESIISTWVLALGLTVRNIAPDPTGEIRKLYHQYAIEKFRGLSNNDLSSWGTQFAETALDVCAFFCMFSPTSELSESDNEKLMTLYDTISESSRY